MERGWSESGGPRRIREEQMRELLLGKAVELLRPTGLTVSLEHLNLEELIRSAGVPRSSVYKAFGNKDAFFRELMIRLIETMEISGSDLDPGLAQRIQATAHAHGSRLGTPAGRREVGREIIRLSVKKNYESVRTSTEWRTYIALSATVSSLDPTSRTAVVDALARAESRTTAARSAAFDQLLPLLGLKFRVGLDARQLATVAAAIVNGLAQRSLVNPEVVDTPVVLPGIDGDPVEWHLSAVGVMAVLDEMTEPIEGAHSA
ncbi:TetR/AcrR family transcriptional regulator [Sinomonas sp. P10A9]|uniref:TetR/AcrR family transcriptional regulator n=1 Tax=Sinomonas puerhi TaxID=3238584 RepID=A0AB39L170_9MICC